ncbi:MAG: hypothetical protein K8R88_11775 [Armatimonadetes bacterium]|nr:hypothetical protein [Armatimonadota bacterium]
MRRSLVAVALLSLVTVSAFAQSDSLLGSEDPTSIKLSDLSTEFRAYRIDGGSQGGGGMMGMMSQMFLSPVVMLGSLFGNGPADDNGQAQLLSAIDLAWSKGKKIKIEGESFLVIYKLEYENFEVGGKTAPKFEELSVGLQYMKVSSINTIAPKPTMTPDKLRAIIKAGIEAQAKKAAAGFGAISETPAEAPATVVDAPTTAPDSPDRMAEILPAMKNNSFESGRSCALSIMSGLRAYASKHKGLLPRSMENSQLKRMFADLGVQSTWSTQNPAGSQFVINPRFKGARLNALKKGAPIIWDSKSNNGTRLVVFVNGESEIMADANWTRLARRFGVKP